MAKIHRLKIKNYRGIESFEHTFDGQSFICLIGRGDSGKTTILQAIAAILSPHWDYKFYDSDFHNENIENPIVIEADIIDIPFELLTETKYGLYKRILNSEGIISDDLSEEDDGCKDLLTVRLVVDKDLEPKWYVINKRERQDSIEIRAADRAKLNVFIISDYIDRHFVWGKGTPLNALLRKNEEEINTDQIIVDVSRKAHRSIKQERIFESFDNILSNLQEEIQSLGMPPDTMQALFDFKSLLLKEGNIALHDGMSIPYRLKGKGTKRLVSIAIQMELAKEGGIILIDEIEQGLEPDRAKFLVKKLKEINKGQIFITTHSNNVLVELNYSDLLLKNTNHPQLIRFNNEMIIRSYS
ncbi:MAG: AAA family ATPase [Proteiniphilum sp.]|uniref:ATP-dependent nuclease n=1 Tax=Proteiniphilum sp. TaxID=1926877 RepID=UPI002ABA2C78|nr:AAA family ATPase [Proteiniphilum sp.]MDY9918637.1 AAA family ATPase [Proteiniphilum sp.]